MTGIDAFHIFRTNLIMGNRLSPYSDDPRLPQQSGIKVERSLELVLIKHLDKSNVLGNTIVVAQSKGFSFSFRP